MSIRVATNECKLIHILRERRVTHEENLRIHSHSMLPNVRATHPERLRFRSRTKAHVLPATANSRERKEWRERDFTDINGALIFARAEACSAPPPEEVS
ncbi:hypothetical protein NDU88_005045 [Pleurodeles waltl]|uniref:Uncharacterized protein n=1 Tax=Pleurodeles waltl TaxID=8319 RepID=A0AAV7LBF3_PLEWA|nr:hypothetical protein NDU88_005045 [Pleurodeles waltl]